MTLMGRFNELLQHTLNYNAATVMNNNNSSNTSSAITTPNGGASLSGNTDAGVGGGAGEESGEATDLDNVVGGVVGNHRSQSVSTSQRNNNHSHRSTRSTTPSGVDRPHFSNSTTSSSSASSSSSSSASSSCSLSREEVIHQQLKNRPTATAAAAVASISQQPSGGRSRSRTSSTIVVNPPTSSVAPSSSSRASVARHHSFTPSSPSQSHQNNKQNSQNHQQSRPKSRGSGSSLARSKSAHHSSSPTAPTPTPTVTPSSGVPKNRAQRIEYLKNLLVQTDLTRQQIHQYKHQQHSSHSHSHRDPKSHSQSQHNKQQQQQQQQHYSSSRQPRSSSQQPTIKKRVPTATTAATPTPTDSLRHRQVGRTTSATVASQQSHSQSSSKQQPAHVQTSHGAARITPIHSVPVKISSSVRSQPSTTKATAATTTTSSPPTTSTRVSQAPLSTESIPTSEASTSKRRHSPILTGSNNKNNLNTILQSVVQNNHSNIAKNHNINNAKREQQQQQHRSLLLQASTPSSTVASTPQTASSVSAKVVASSTTTTKAQTSKTLPDIQSSKSSARKSSTQTTPGAVSNIISPTAVGSFAASAASTVNNIKHSLTTTTSTKRPEQTTMLTEKKGAKILDGDHQNNNNHEGIQNNNHVCDSSVNFKPKHQSSKPQIVNKPLPPLPHQQTQQPSPPATVEPEESLASKFARKMKISTLARKSSNAANLSTAALRSSIEKSLNKVSNKQKTSNKEQRDEGKNASGEGCFIHRYLNGHLSREHPDIISGKTCYDLPVKEIAPLSSKVVASCTGPHGGLLTIKRAPSKPFDLADQVDFIDEDYPDSSLSSSNSNHGSPKSAASTSASSASSSSSSDEETLGSSTNSSPINSPSDKQRIAGLEDWHCARDFAYGISTSLYELHPFSKTNAGDPIADSFALATRENSAIIALADGVNWGAGASLASRSAVHGCVDYLHSALYSAAESTQIKNTLDIFVALLRSFRAAHNLILTQGGHLTTLCAAVICQLKDSNRFIVCTCNVGDSLAYVYSPTFGVREITEGSHDIFSMRDMRDALGALGPVSGDEPELSNLTVSMTVVDEGDIVFLTSDGITDNFDPVVGKFAMPRKDMPNDNAQEQEKKENGESDKSKKGNEDKKNKQRKKVQRSTSNPERTSRKNTNFTSKGLPLVTGKQRHELTLLRMEDLITNGVNNVSDNTVRRDKNAHKSSASRNLSAKELCSVMVDFATKLSIAKRRILEDEELYSEDDDGTLRTDEAHRRQKARRRKVGGRLMQMPGKLDHATIAAIEIGFYGEMLRTQAKHAPRAARIVNSHHSTLSKSFANDSRYNLKARATLARFESQESLDGFCESGPI